MSWFDTVKNIAKTVADNVFATTVLQGAGAVPINNDGYWSVLRRSVTSRNDPGEFSSESDSDSERNVASTSAAGVSQVTTRARFTYELDRFRKNALLLFVQIKSETQGSSRVQETTTEDINILINTLNAFRFEDNIHIDLTCAEIENKCQEFFEQNFSEYGAVIVVVLTFEGLTDCLSALDGQFSETIILRHFTNDLNPTLLNKPKIYITEAYRVTSSEIEPRLSLSLEGYSDILGLHLPTIEYQDMIRRPLQLLCDNIKNMADTHDLATIVKKSVDDIETVAESFQGKRIEFNNTLTKEMILARS